MSGTLPSLSSLLPFHLSGHNDSAVVDNAQGADSPCSPIVAMSCMLIALGGLPGTGKTSLARGLARVLDAVHLRIDTIEQAICDATAADAVGTAGYVIAYAVAEDNLRLGRTVVADCVNPLEITRAGWAAVAERSAVALLQVEVICSDPLEHRRRVESRRSDMRGLTLPTWDEVMARDYQPWTGARAVIDTARRPVEACVMELHALLLARERALR